MRSGLHEKSTAKGVVSGGGDGSGEEKKKRKKKEKKLAAPTFAETSTTSHSRLRRCKLAVRYLGSILPTGTDSSLRRWRCRCTGGSASESDSSYSELESMTGG
jgi:hypothetical protein